MDIQNNLSSNALRKVALLITKAADIEMVLSGYGQAAENPRSGYVYLWLEDYPFTLFIDLGGSDRIRAMWTDPETGEEHEMDAHDATLFDLESWCEELIANMGEETEA